LFSKISDGVLQLIAGKQMDATACGRKGPLEKKGAIPHPGDNLLYGRTPLIGCSALRRFVADALELQVLRYD
jgi:hypothetical protein